MGNRNLDKEFIEVNNHCNFEEIFEIFKGVIYQPSKENVKSILTDYEKSQEKTLYGYFLNKKLVGIIGVMRNTENTEILHLGAHSKYRGMKLGTEAINFIKKENKTIILSTDDDAITFYQKYGFKSVAYFEEKYQKTRYNCTYKQSTNKEN